MVQQQKTFDPDVVEAVYRIICDNPGIYRQQLTNEINKIYHVSKANIEDILFYLRLSRGLYARTSRGVYRDDETRRNADR